MMRPDDENPVEEQAEGYQEEPGETIQNLEAVDDLQEGRPAEVQPGSVDPATATEMIQEAKSLLYGDNFENMMKVFQTAGLDGFPEAMATVVVGTIDRLESDMGQQDPGTLLVVATGLVAMLATDLAEGNMMPDLNGDAVQMALQAVVGKWMKAHPDRADVEGAQQAVREEAMQGEAPMPEQGYMTGGGF